jgi:hypothetical protein
MLKSALRPTYRPALVPGNRNGLLSLREWGKKIPKLIGRPFWLHRLELTEPICELVDTDESQCPT